MPISRTALVTAPVAVVGSLALAVGTASGAQAAESHEVQPGETITGIAARNGLAATDVMRWNDLDYAAARGLQAGQELRLTAPETTSSAQKPSSAEPTAEKTKADTHTVSSGDTLWSIASEHGIALDALLKANGLKASAIIYPGQKLALAGAATASPALASSTTKTADTSSSSHAVAAGDTLWAIASANGITVADLLEANGLERGAVIYPGQKLTIASGAGANADADENPQRRASLDDEQVENARLIVSVGRDVGAGDRAIAEALATAMVESSLRNVDHGDLDSLGLFQQRTSQGWGTHDQVMDRTRAVKAFFGGASDPNGYRTRGLFDVAGWTEMPFGEPAQIVQFSGHPDRYAQWESQAYDWVGSLG